MPVSSTDRGSWTSRLGFVLAAAGSAVGLGNIWKFPYVAGRNGGGLFIAAYIACVALVALPIMVAEIMVGRTTQRSPIAAFRALSGGRSSWTTTGWLGVIAGFVILSYYAVVAGWSLYYTGISLADGFYGQDAQAISGTFSDLVSNGPLNVGLSAAFMAICIAVVVGGVRSGIERWSDILMPALFLLLVGIVVYGMFLPGRDASLDFLFGLRAEEVSAGAFIEAMGQAFFSMSLGMGAMLTYGSYLPRHTSVLKASIWVAVVDTAVALLAGLMIFPLTFTHGVEPGSGPGLVFQSIPLAFSQVAGGRLLATIFFLLLLFAGLTSAVSLLEVVVSSAIDLLGWDRRRATVIAGGSAFLLSIPSALSHGSLFGAELKRWIGMSFFDLMETISSNWMLPLGGGLIALFAGWSFDSTQRRQEFSVETSGRYYLPWLAMVRFVCPGAIALIRLRGSGLLERLGVGL